jgi:hypothetical protein
MIPQQLRSLFWDVDGDKFDPASYPQYTMARVLEFGDQEAVAWLRRAFSAQEIKEVVCKERRLTRRSATFWALVYAIPHDQVAALQRPQ